MMGQLFKLYKNENNTDISLYHVYILKLHENILKYHRLDLFKEITDFNHSLLMTLKSPVNLFYSFLI